MKRKLVVMLAVALLLAVAVAAPAMADKPVTFSDSDTFTDVNPCTGLEHEITINLEGSIHEHQNNMVVKAQRSGSADDGSTMIAGTDTFVVNKGGERGTFFDQWRNPAGYKYMVHGNYLFNANKGEVLVLSVTLTCIGNG
jgi:hypothetical protein